jgi:hypothetical protein
MCKACHKVYRRQHYLDNREKYIKKARRWNREYVVQYRTRAREYIYAYLQSHPCVDCGETDPLVLDFDHVRGVKRESISQLVRSQATLEVIKAEIAKCDVRCANCHRRKTAKERGHWVFSFQDSDDDDTI